MESSQLPQTRNDGVQFIEIRDKLYYNKYKYRARIRCKGLYLMWYSKNGMDLQDKIDRENTRRTGYRINKDTIVKFYYWKIENKGNKCTIRVEGDTGSVFSNDLEFLKTLDSIESVEYTEVKQESIAPMGIKYFTKEPKHKYRFHLKSKRVPEDWADKLKTWVEKYEGTGTVISPSAALKQWYTPIAQSPSNPFIPSWNNSWRKHWCSSHFYIDYDDESTLTLFMLIFDSMIQRRYKLEKRP